MCSRPSGSEGPPPMGLRSGSDRARGVRHSGAGDRGVSAGGPFGIRFGAGPCRPSRSVTRREKPGQTRSPSRLCRLPTATGRLGGASTYTARLVTRRSTFGCLFEIVETLVLTLIIFLVIQTFVAQPYKVQQQSMEHTLEPDQYVLVDKLTPRFDTYKRGDIVVFTPPPDWSREDDTPFIKRVIGLGGETVEIHDGERLHQRHQDRRAVPVRARARRSRRNRRASPATSTGGSSRPARSS